MFRGVRGMEPNESVGTTAIVLGEDKLELLSDL